MKQWFEEDLIRYNIIKIISVEKKKSTRIVLIRKNKKQKIKCCKLYIFIYSFLVYLEGRNHGMKSRKIPHPK